MPQTSPVRLGTGLVAAALLCFALAVFLLAFPLVAALIVAGILGFAGCALLGTGITLWRAESALRRRMNAAPQPPAGPEVVKDAEGSWRDGMPGT